MSLTGDRPKHPDPHIESRRPKVDLPLLRRRADHNDGIVSTLREVTLHQFDIERIENLDVYCRRLRILFLQNNVISKIGGLEGVDLESPGLFGSMM